MVYYYPQRHTSEEIAIPAIIAAQESLIAEALFLLDQQLASKKYLLGDKISACGFFLFMLAEWSLKIEKPPLSFPNLGKYLINLAKRPTISKVCKKEGINLKAFQ